MDILDSIGEGILSWADPNNDVRGYTEGWFLTDFRSAALVAIYYVAFVVVGSAIMKSGVLPAMDPYPIKFFYNISQIMLCSYMTIEAALLAYRNSYTVMPCVTFDTENPPLANLLWIFYISKVWDFWDTIFIVIGKKWKQLSFLHVYHHTTIFLFYWLNSNVLYDGDIYLTILLNGFIHTVMYTYYFICMHTKIPGANPPKSVPIWWKSSLTMMQMIQFVTMMTQATILIVGQCSTLNFRVTALYGAYIFSLLILFAQFFVQSYMKPKKKKA